MFGTYVSYNLLCCQIVTFLKVTVVVVSLRLTDESFDAVRENLQVFRYCQVTWFVVLQTQDMYASLDVNVMHCTNPTLAMIRYRDSSIKKAQIALSILF